jgi:hypothetical protein
MIPRQRVNGETRRDRRVKKRAYKKYARRQYAWEALISLALCDQKTVGPSACEMHEVDANQAN